MRNPRHFFRHSWAYWALWQYLRFWHYIVFYRKVRVQDYPQHLHRQQPLIIVANHQNSLMDPLAILFSLVQIQPVFLARASVFKSPVIRKFLTFLKMLPVYRIRDGLDNMSKNELIFEQCSELLTHGRTIGLFPEGNHGDGYVLRPLKKGTARIAFMAEQDNDWQLGVSILPVALHYTDCKRMGEVLTVKFGKMFRIKHYKQLFLENESKATLDLTAEIATHITNTMNDLATPPSTPKAFGLVDKLLLVLTLPLAVVGALANALPFYLPILLTKAVRDKQFVASIRFVVYALVAFPLYYLILGVVCGSFFSLKTTLLLLLITACMGYFAHQWFNTFRTQRPKQT